ncbi:MAG TPA: FtsX-like permease family protein [Planctomycetaceae bacterium]|jgi:ABC-type lipoprotein release transport system permease subunit
MGPPKIAAFDGVVRVLFFSGWKELSVVLGCFLGLMVLLFLIGKVPVSYNVRNLMIRWKTTVMTGLAFTLVVALMTVMLAFVNGMYKLTEKSGQPGNVIVLSEGATDESFSVLTFVDSADIEREPGVLKNDAGAALCSKEVFVIVNQEVPVPQGEKPRRRFVQVRGVEEPDMAATVHGLKLKAGGQWFSEAGIEELEPEAAKSATNVAIQAVLGHGLAAELGNDRPENRPLATGDTFSLGARTWKVVGILDSTGSTFDSEVWAKRARVGEDFGKANVFSSYLLRTSGPQAAETLAEQLKGYKKAPLNPQPETKYFQLQAETGKQFLVAIIIVAVVMAVGGVFGVMNTMYAAISQRTKDIGVLRILGYARWQILVSFLLESLVLALLGGLLGCAIGMLADGLSARSVVSSGPGGGKSVVLQMVVSREILMSGLLLSLGMGAIGGFLPAVSAMRLRALESLR